MDMVDRLSNTAFLGKEFLTWLWYKSDTQEGLIPIEDGGPVAEVWLTDSIMLSGAGEGAEKVTVKAEDPSLSPEARMALRQGKKVEKAMVRIVRGQREWTTTVAGETLALSSIKIPALLTREEDEKLRERLALIDQLDAMIVALFQAFLAVRCETNAWETERRAMMAWIQNDVGIDAGRTEARYRSLRAAEQAAGEAADQSYVPEPDEDDESDLSDDGVLDEDERIEEVA